MSAHIVNGNRVAIGKDSPRAMILVRIIGCTCWVML